MPGKKYKESLIEAYPKIAKEWAYDLNHPDVPEKCPPRSGKVVHWRCELGHVWKARIAQRTANLSGCPYCSGRRCLPETSLSALKPEIAKLWDPEKNANLTPFEVSPDSGRPAHWKCHKGHEWKRRVQAVVRSGGYCAMCNSLALQYPDIARQWDYRRNPDTPFDVAGASPQKRYWQCDADETHSWQATVASRTRQGTGCRQCANQAVSLTNNLQYLAPELAGEYDIAANGSAPDQVVATSAKKVWWVCSQGPDHRWKAPILKRYVYKNGCPYCAGKLPSVTNTLASLYPEKATQFDSNANGISPDQVVAGSNSRYQWICPVAPDHVWSNSPNNRTSKNQGCPACSGRQVSVTNSLESLFPDLARELDPELNDGVTAKDVVAGSNRRFKWRCIVNAKHVWTTTPNKRTSGSNPTGCPYCSGRQVLPENSLAAVRPDIAAEWDMERNGDRRPDQVGPSSDYRAKWICSQGHRWSTKVDHRTRYDVSCGYAECNLTPRSATEIFLLFEISVFFRINPDDQTIQGPTGMVGNVDIKMPDERLVVEFDGTHWHSGKEDRDTRKSEWLRDAGWEVIRIRDHGLGPITLTDVRVDTRCDSHKEIADGALKRIFEVLGRDKAQLDDYLAKSGLVKESEAAAYIKSYRERKRERAQDAQLKAVGRQSRVAGTGSIRIFVGAQSPVHSLL